MSNPLAFCSVSISPTRAEPSDSCEMVSQLLFGETIEILAQDRQWKLVKSLSDSYQGWMDEKCLTLISDQERLTWEQNRKMVASSIHELTGPEGKIVLTKGAYIAKSGLEFIIGSTKYSIQNSPESFNGDMVQFASTYLNAPYLWGGKTLFGIDCSGFTQMVYRFFDLELPRDAFLQEQLGQKVDFEKRIEGDLAFFKNANGKIHHVGIVLNDNRIIHAHGWVRIDELTEKGIVSRTTEGLSHQLESIKRYK